MNKDSAVDDSGRPVNGSRQKTYFRILIITGWNSIDDEKIKLYYLPKTFSLNV